MTASSSWRFLTISYVWGKAALEITTIANRRDREQQGALSKLNLPQLILDEMLLVSRLGERYLWVDCLCIEQDDPSQKHSQISQMDVIYSQSFLTLVAFTSEDAGSSLPGIRKGTRSFFKAKNHVFNRDIYAIYPHLLELSEAAVYESRGWTLQERLLSRRCLYLTECDMYYTCHSRLSCDTGASSSKSEMRIFEKKCRNIFAKLDTFKAKRSGWPSTFALYASIVHEYSQRELSYDTDVINAFSGVCATLGHFLNSSSVGGLLECVLDVCLLWVPGKNNTHTRNINFPSWSWAGWKGEVFYPSRPLYSNGAVYYNPGPSLLLLMSLVENFETQSRTPLRPIVRLLQDLEEIIIVNKQPERPTKEIDLLSFEAFTADVVQLNIAAEESVVRGEFFLASNETPSFPVRIFKIMDGNRKMCGYLHFSPGILPTTRTQYHRELLGLSLSNLEVTLYDRNSAENDSCNVLFDERAFEKKPWCLLNIMLIEWKGMEAERVTIGQMHKDAWNTLKRQRKNIRLI